MSEAKYITGPLAIHIREGMIAASLGMVAIFLVDLVDMAFIAQLGEPALAASVGFAGILLFFASALGMALSVASSTLVSQALGRDDTTGAAQAFLDVTLVGLVLSVLVAVVAHIYARPLLALLGAEGMVLDEAQSYFRIVNLGMPMLVVGMCSGAALRGAGLVRKSMIATLVGGALNAVFDPIFIFGFNWGLEGAAYATLLSRVGVVGLGLYFAVVQQGLLKGCRLADVFSSLGPVMAIGIPSLIASLSTPFGSAYVTRALAPYGEEVIAGVSVFGRLMPLAFVGILTLAMTMAPIVGQNFGADRRDRVGRALVLAGGISLGYVLVVATLLSFLAPWLVAAFQLEGTAADILIFYCRLISFTYVFFGLHISATQTLTAMGRPLLATISNLTRDLALAIPLIAWASTFNTPTAIIWAQYGATIITGFLTYGLTLLYIHRSLISSVNAQVSTYCYHRPVTPYIPSRGH